MNAKCNFCEFFGEKQHCHSCRVLNKAKPSQPIEIEDDLETLVDNITNNDPSSFYSVGDYKHIELYTGEKVRFVLLGFNHDVLTNGNAVNTTFGIFGLDGAYEMHDLDTHYIDWSGSDMRCTKLPRILRLLPKVITDNVKPVVKTTYTFNGDIAKTTDTAFLFSESEVFPTLKHSRGHEGGQYEFFKDKDSLHTFCGSNWFRSSGKEYGYSFCCIDKYRHPDYNACGTLQKISFGICI